MGATTKIELAAFYRRYNACWNEHRVDDVGEFVLRHVEIDGVIRGLGPTPPSYEPLFDTPCFAGHTANLEQPEVSNEAILGERRRGLPRPRARADRWLDGRRSRRIASLG